MRGRRASFACSCSLAHLFREWGIVDEWHGTEAVDRVASTVPDRLAGRTWLRYSYHKLMRLLGECFMLRLA